MSDSSTVAMAPTWDRIRTGQSSSAPKIIREVVVDATRAFFKQRGFHEVETPLLVRHPGMEPHLDAFATKWRTATGAEHPGYLTTSPEYAMKKLLAAGISPIFQICKSFRNGENVSARHNPEFTILDRYRANADYRDLMRDCEELFCEVAEAVRDRGLAQNGSASPSDSADTPSMARVHSQQGDDPHPSPIPGGEGKERPATLVYRSSPAAGRADVSPLPAGRGRPQPGEGTSAPGWPTNPPDEAEPSALSWPYQGGTIDWS